MGIKSVSIRIEEEMLEKIKKKTEAVLIGFITDFLNTTSKSGNFFQSSPICFR